jgi:hypothetical protein
LQIENSSVTAGLLLRQLVPPNLEHSVPGRLRPSTYASPPAWSIDWNIHAPPIMGFSLVTTVVPSSELRQTDA